MLVSGELAPAKCRICGFRVQQNKGGLTNELGILDYIPGYLCVCRIDACDSQIILGLV